MPPRFRHCFPPQRAGWWPGTHRWQNVSVAPRPRTLCPRAVRRVWGAVKVDLDWSRRARCVCGSDWGVGAGGQWCSGGGWPGWVGRWRRRSSCSRPEWWARCWRSRNADMSTSELCISGAWNKIGQVSQKHSKKISKKFCFRQKLVHD